MRQKQTLVLLLRDLRKKSVVPIVQNVQSYNRFAPFTTGTGPFQTFNRWAQFKTFKFRNQKPETSKISAH
jgi:hypothetical protein